MDSKGEKAARELAEKFGGEMDALRKERDEARLAHQCSEATLAMAVARLGGEVEGAPTARVNFLQRIDELRRVEAGARADNEALRAKLEETLMKAEAAEHNGGLWEEEAKGLRARVQKVEGLLRATEGIARATGEDACQMAARLSKLDALLASEEPPAGLQNSACLTVADLAAAGRAWRWFREQLGAPAQGQVVASNSQEFEADLEVIGMLEMFLRMAEDGSGRRLTEGWEADDGSMQYCLGECWTWLRCQKTSRERALLAAPPAEPQEEIP